MITQKELKDKLHYDPKTGVFTRIKSYHKKFIGKETGNSLDSYGYAQICVNNTHYLAHRLAWLYVYGYWPENEIDHINRIRDDNKIENLREATRTCNCINSGVRNNNSSGITGVYFRKDMEKWGSKICVAGMQINLGFFDTKRKAAQARWEAEKKYDFPNCNTTSSALQYLNSAGL